VIFRCPEEEIMNSRKSDTGVSKPFMADESIRRPIAFLAAQMMDRRTATDEAAGIFPAADQPRIL